MKYFVLCLFVFCVFTPSPCHPFTLSPCQEKRPNILLVVADGVRLGQIGCYGGKGKLATPHLDRLAKEGVRYETAWSVSLDKAARVTLLTGRYPFRHERLKPEEFSTFVRILRDSGYATAFGGKWRVNDLNAVGFEARYGAPDAASGLTRFIQRGKDKPLLIYYSLANTDNADHVVGQMLNAVEQAGLQDNTAVIVTSVPRSRASSVERRPLVDADVRVPFIVRAPFLTDGGRTSRALIDFTDLYPTLLELGKASPLQGVVLDGRSLAPSLRGSDDPFEKRNWIYAQLGDFRVLRDWQHVIDTQGSFHDLTKDPLQQNKVSPFDKIAPGRRQRLQRILDRLAGKKPRIKHR